MEVRETLARKRVDEEEHLEICRCLKYDMGMITYFPDPVDENAGTAFPCRGLDPPERRGGASVVGCKRKKPLCALVATQTRVEPHMVGECELHKEERDVIEEEMRK